ncbi:hypothetical protein Taro_039336 [Colocasia esculenta]|uniref:Nuclease HARBI1 n=1 Tax=Colocasia esculenta TaxID=4460 RepID=A0A843W926_COLES|nr:hypothetical protein [Colocasia esculenta]
MPPYSFPKQVKIVVASMTIHNFLIDQKMSDSMYMEFADENRFELERMGGSASNTSEEDINSNNMVDSSDMATIRDRIRDEIWRVKDMHWESLLFELHSFSFISMVANLQETDMHHGDVN